MLSCYGVNVICKCWNAIIEAKNNIVVRKIIMVPKLGWRKVIEDHPYEDTIDGSKEEGKTKCCIGNKSNQILY